MDEHNTAGAREPSVAWITGAAGGLGEALTEAFCAAGWRVAASHHRKSAHTEAENLWPLAVDVTQAAAAENAAQQIMQRWGRLDALVNNAGVIADGAVWSLAEDDWDRVVDVSLKGAFLCSRAAAAPMAEQQGGHIINISSFSARSGHAGQSNYSAAKAGLIGLTQSLAKELGRRGVQVNAVLPGVLPTPMTRDLSAARLQELTEANALKRLNSLPEVAAFVCFLARMKNVSGQVFQLDSRIARWT